jgi:hypothetical protein
LNKSYNIAKIEKTYHYGKFLSSGPGSQAVRQGSAKPSFRGSIPLLAFIYILNYKIMRIKFFIGSIVLTIVFLFLIGCAPQTATVNQPVKSGGQDCQADSECISGVCNFIKENFGVCQAAQCLTSDQAVGINARTTFYCDQNNQWQKIKHVGETCNHDYECEIYTCKDNPGCHPEDYRYYCKDKKCVAEKQPDECELKGLKRIITEYLDLNTCTESIAQHEIGTACAPCGNGKCDSEVENKCNCPADCK